MPSADKELVAFVGRALDRGIERDEIEAALVEAGWPSSEVRAALDAYAPVSLAMAVPRPRPSVSARDAFFYLLLFLTLGLSAFFLGGLFFEVVDRFVPDPLRPTYRRGSDSWLRWCISMLVVAFPIHLLVARRVARDIAGDPAKRASAARKWLTHIALLIAALVLIGDLVALVFNFLQGDLTLRVALKIAIIALIAMPIFAYYYRSVSDEAEHSSASG